MTEQLRTRPSPRRRTRRWKRRFVALAMPFAALAALSGGAAASAETTESGGTKKTNNCVAVRVDTPTDGGYNDYQVKAVCT